MSALQYRTSIRGPRLAGSCCRYGPSGAAAETADSAVGVIQAFYATLLTVMKHAKELGIRGRYSKIAPAIEATFDLPAMTRIAVGPEWNSLSDSQRTVLIDRFTRMTVATYANRFDGYAGERFVVEPRPEPRNTGQIVRTKLIQSNGEPITLNYLMRLDERWRVVDVYLTGTISELATRRAEFGAILRSGGPDALSESLRQQADRLMGVNSGELGRAGSPQ